MLLVGRDARADLANHRADLNRGVRVRLEVVKPRGVRRLTGLRGRHRDGIAILVVHQRRRAPYPALGARVVDQDDPGVGPAGNMAAELATRPPV
jgi:hypothetical protein